MTSMVDAGSKSGMTGLCHSGESRNPAFDVGSILEFLTFNPIAAQPKQGIQGDFMLPANPPNPFAKGPSGFSVGAYSLKIEIATLRSR